jgi:hypothetical protein
MKLSIKRARSEEFFGGVHHEILHISVFAVQFAIFEVE